MTQTDDRFRIAVLCTGNRFRSPLAAALLQRRLEGVPSAVGSAGTLELDRPALREAVELARERGLDLSAHRTRFLPPRSLGRADIVLGFEPAHLAAAQESGGAPPERTFTLPELVGLLDGVDVDPALPRLERARAAVAAAAQQRVLLGAAGREPPILEDPLGQPYIVFVELAATIERLVDRLVERLFG
jgi:protein-tyrosine phosphatase